MKGVSYRSVLKLHILKTSSLLILILAGVLCITTLWSYGSNAPSTQNYIVSSNSFPSERNPLLGNISQSD